MIDTTFYKYKTRLNQSMRGKILWYLLDLLSVKNKHWCFYLSSFVHLTNFIKILVSWILFVVKRLDKKILISLANIWTFPRRSTTTKEEEKVYFLTQKTFFRYKSTQKRITSFGGGWPCTLWKILGIFWPFRFLKILRYS